MNKGFTLKSFLIILGVILLMASVAFFVQRNDEDYFTDEVDELNEEEYQEFYDEIEEEIDESDEKKEIQEEQEEVDDYNDYQEKDNDNEKEVAEIEDIDCGDANDLVAQAKNDLALSLNIDINKIRVVSCQKNVFSDHTLGTSGPGEVYPQKETEGYVIILNFNNQEYRYHGNNDILLFIN